MRAVNDIDLVQDITTDCSVVASLCAGTARALKGHGKVVLIARRHNYQLTICTAPRICNLPL